MKKTVHMMDSINVRVVQLVLGSFPHGKFSNIVLRYSGLHGVVPPKTSYSPSRVRP